jgi:hypothetical protein
MPDCKDLTDIDQNPPCNEKELASHEAQAPDDSSGRVSQPLLRHANSRTTMDLDTHAVSADKRSASQRQIELLLA